MTPIIEFTILLSGFLLACWLSCKAGTKLAERDMRNGSGPMPWPGASGKSK